MRATGGRDTFPADDPSAGAFAKGSESGLVERC